jgi:hypothetical protein
MLRAAPVIGKLRVRTGRSDSAALRLAVERQVQAGEFQARGAGPSAILLIRRMANPLPLGASSEWRRALQARIDELCATATRPENGRLPGGSEAVLFTDEAELLACLVLEIRLGTPPSWWRLAIARYLDHSRLFSLCRAQAALLPAVFDLLVRWKRIEEVIEALDEAEALELCAIFAAAHDLQAVANTVLRFHAGCRDLAEAQIPGAEPPANLTHAGKILVSPESTEDVDRAVVTQRAVRRIDTWIPASCATLSLPRRLLLALVIGFRHQPRVIASRRFVVELGEWLQCAASPVATVGPIRAMPTTLGRAPADASVSGHEGHRAVPPASLPEGFAACTMPETAHADVAQPTDAKTPAAEIPAATPEPYPDLEGVATELGGVFMLINVMEHLELLECFEESCGLASSVSTLGTLEALARVLAGTRGEELAHDPIWSMLADLDRREPHSPPRAEGLHSPDAKLPDAWLAQLGDEALALRESDRLAIEALRRSGWAPALVDWLTLVIPFVGWRIAQACALDSIDDAVRLLIDLPARVYVTASHIDVVTSIESIRVPLRLAGLDRSPGWVRSMQRVVLFHFE